MNGPLSVSMNEKSIELIFFRNYILYLLSSREKF